MHITAILLAALPSLAAAASGTLGFALGAQNPDGSCKTTKDYTADFKVLEPHSSIVRGYSASQCNTAAAILPAAKSAGVKVILGIWYVKLWLIHLANGYCD
jgi:glucan 1,3-beta-glucosidase